MTRLLVVDDSPLMRRLLGAIFEAEEDFTVAFARNGEEAIEKLHAFQPDVVTLDVHMPGVDGIECLDRIMVERPCPVVMVSSLTEEGAGETLQALELGAIDFIPKPAGAVTLEMDLLAPRLLEKVRSAATAQLRPTLRLADRVRARSGGAIKRRQIVPGPAPARVAVPAGVAGPQGLVLVGTSTGGPQALDALLAPLPGDFPWPILIAQHMPATFTGPLARRLDRLCGLEVRELDAPTALTPGVWVARGDADLVIRKQGKILIGSPAPSDPAHRWHPSVDRMVRSAMNLLPAAELIGVLMTGMGDDGAAAMAELRAAGGRTIAEAQETAVVWGMPGELVKAGGAEVVAPLEKIAERLIGLLPCK